MSTSDPLHSYITSSGLLGPRRCPPSDREIRGSLSRSYKAGTFDPSITSKEAWWVCREDSSSSAPPPGPPRQRTPGTL